MTFTDEQLQQLRLQYGAIRTIDPDGPARERLVGYLSRLPHKTIVQLAGANIRWVSYEANRILGKKVRMTTSHPRDNGAGFLIKGVE